MSPFSGYNQAKDENVTKPGSSGGARIIAAIGGGKELDVLKIARSCAKGGIKPIVIRWSAPRSSSIVYTLANDPLFKGVIGAGMILSDHEALEAIDAGARFVSSPVFDEGIWKVCRKSGVPYVPGFMSIAELLQIRAKGIKVMHLFPASQFKPDYLDIIDLIDPSLQIIAHGGMDEARAVSWLKAGAHMVAIGNEFFRVYELGGAKAVESYARSLASL